MRVFFASIRSLSRFPSANPFNGLIVSIDGVGLPAAGAAEPVDDHGVLLLVLLQSHKIHTLTIVEQGAQVGYKHVEVADAMASVVDTQPVEELLGTVEVLPDAADSIVHILTGVVQAVQVVRLVLDDEGLQKQRHVIVRPVEIGTLPKSSGWSKTGKIKV
jgi:hypothetical protein